MESGTDNADLIADLAGEVKKKPRRHQRRSHQRKSRQHEPRSTSTQTTQTSSSEIGPYVDKFAVVCSELREQIRNRTAAEWNRKAMQNAREKGDATAGAVCNESEVASLTGLVNVCRDLCAEIGTLEYAISVRAEPSEKPETDIDLAWKVDNLNMAVADIVCFVLATQSPSPKSFGDLLSSGAKVAAFDGLCAKIVRDPKLTSVDLAGILDKHVSSCVSGFPGNVDKKRRLDFVACHLVIPERDRLRRFPDLRKAAPDEALIIDNFELICELFNVLGC